VLLAEFLNSLPVETPKYLIRGKNAKVPIQAVMFLTKTYSEEGRQSRKVYFIDPDQREGIEEDSVIIEVKRGSWKVVSKDRKEE
jgi:hypothetical protein